MKNADMFVWLIGAGGMLGQEVKEIMQIQNIPFVYTDLDCDITSYTSLENFARGKSITHIINCAAYTAVDRAEDEPEKAYALNALGPKNIAVLSAEINAVLVHISTDYVFDGSKKEGYNENEEPHPLSVYGKTKALGEKVIIEELTASFIVRTAWLYGKYGKNFVETMLKLMNERDEISVVNDQHGSPTYAVDLAKFIVWLIINKEPYGVYHFTNKGELTWYEFAEHIYRLGREMEIITSDCKIHAIASAEYPTKAIRPTWSKLLQTKQNYENNHYLTALQQYLEARKWHRK
jgi:dTDP-4-dehydrorhamnose reductase